MEGNDGNAQVKQSLNICWSAAIIIIQLACTMSESERTYLTMSPVTLYAFIAAMRVHLAFALGTYKMSDFSKLMFTKGRDIMKKLPQNSGPSMFKESLDELNDIFSSKVPSLPPQPPSTINHCNVRRTSLPSMSFSRELAVEGSTKPPACITNEKHSRKGSTQMRFHQYNPDSNQFEKGKQPCKRVRHDSQPERKPGKARKQTAESDLTTSEFSATTFANASITATNNIWSNSSNPAMYMSQPSPASLTSSTALFEEPVQSAIEQGSSLFIQEMINSMGQQYAQSIPNGQNDQTVEVEFPMQIVGGDHGFGIQLFDFMDTAGWQFPFTVQSQQFECAEHVQQYPTPPPFNMGDQIDTNGGMIPSTYPS
ncbi:hypothetical protein DFQ28_009679 [Apophysomyces sp. BC1034]|nr:hypothetical protein DFQ28_009679 [Apophysomyces sp. BC1034]